MDRRGSIAARRAPGRFRCLPCKRYVYGTESGHCPNCGFVPPSAPILPPARPAIDPAISVGVLLVAIVVLVYVFVTH